MEEKSCRMKQKAVGFNDESDCEEDKGELKGISLENLSLGTKKKLVVFAPGVLCYHCRVFNRPKNCTQDATFGTLLVYKRPHCEDFLKFCFNRFEVGVWSSCMLYNLNNILDCVMGTLKSKLFIVWGQEHCTDSGYKSLENPNKQLFFKEMKKVWKKSGNSKEKYFLSNTLLVEHRPYKALLNPPNSSIFIPEYKAEEKSVDNVLAPDGELRRFLDGLTDDEDVPSYLKENSLGIALPALTPNDPDWICYSKIMDSLGKD